MDRDSRIDRLHHEIERLEGKLDDFRTVHNNENNERFKVIDETICRQVERAINKRLLKCVTVSSLVVGLLGVIGVFAFTRSIIRQSVKDFVDADTTSLVHQIRNDAQDAQAFRDEAKHRACVVLQTDYGDFAYYMGALNTTTVFDFVRCACPRRVGA